jgi:hypothetical protein
MARADSCPDRTPTETFSAKGSSGKGIRWPRAWPGRPAGAGRGGGTTRQNRAGRHRAFGARMPPEKRRQGLFGCPLPWPSPGAFCGFAVGTPAAGATMRAFVTFIARPFAAWHRRRGLGRGGNGPGQPPLSRCFEAAFPEPLPQSPGWAEGARVYHPGKRRIPEVVLTQKRTLFPYRAHCAPCRNCGPPNR